MNIEKETKKVEKIKFNNTLYYKLVYVFRINDEAHKNVLKIGDASIYTDKRKEELIANCELLNNSAKERINSYTTTAGIKYELLWTELAVNNKNKAFRDHKVHEVLRNSGIKQKTFEIHNKSKEWFETDLDTIKNAITAVKENKNSLFPDQVTNDKSPIIFRPEQEEAIEKTIKRFNIGQNMLWNAKMRFGKTLTALQVAKEKNYKRTIIITHRPVVEKSWFEDFDKIFYDSKNFKVGSKTKSTVKSLEADGCNYVYFASMQDLRGSTKVGGSYDKNNDIFDIEWDFVIIDEAHEGTKTNLGDNVLKEVIKDNTKVLQLSGTPFNLLADFEEKEIYTWDYVMEQMAKKDWSRNHCLDSNPYAELPELNIFTYYLNKILPIYTEVEDSAFNFREFFRVWTGDIETDKEKMPLSSKIGDFKHENDVIKFLNIITKKDENSNYPYSTEEYRDFFRHSLWIVPRSKRG